MGDEVNALRLYLPLVRLGKVLDLQKVLWSRLIWFLSQLVPLWFLVFGFCFSWFVGGSNSGGRIQKSKSPL